MSSPPPSPAAVDLRRAEELPDLLTRKELSSFTGIAVQTLARWAVEKRGPKITRLGHAVRYRRDDVLQFVEQGAV